MHQLCCVDGNNLPSKLSDSLIPACTKLMWEEPTCSFVNWGGGGGNSGWVEQGPCLLSAGVLCEIGHLSSEVAYTSVINNNTWTLSIARVMCKAAHYASNQTLGGMHMLIMSTINQLCPHLPWPQLFLPAHGIQLELGAADSVSLQALAEH